MTRIKAIMIGDSGMHGVEGSGRLAIYPQLTLNSNQAVFDFCYDYSKGGAGWQHMFSPEPAVRALAGLPNGMTLECLLQTTDAQGVLFGLGANDYNYLDDIVAGVIEAKRLCHLYGKMFAFVGIADGNATMAYNASPPPNASFYQSGYVEVCGKLGAAAEILRQVCRYENAVYLDVRNNVPIGSMWSTLTNDGVHPAQAYSTAIYTFVAKSIAS